MPEQFQLPPPPAPPALEQTIGPLFQGLSAGLNTVFGTLTKIPADILGNLSNIGQQATSSIQTAGQQVLAAPLMAMQTTQVARGQSGGQIQSPSLPIPQAPPAPGQILTAQKGTPSGYLA